MSSHSNIKVIKKLGIIDTGNASYLNAITKLDNGTKAKALEGKTELKKDPRFSKSFINQALTRAVFIFSVSIFGWYNSVSFDPN